MTAEPCSLWGPFVVTQLMQMVITVLGQGGQFSQWFPNTSRQGRGYLSKEAGEGLPAPPPWWQLENRVWPSVPAGGLGSAICSASQGWTSAFHCSPESANQIHFLSTTRVRCRPPCCAGLPVSCSRTAGPCEAGRPVPGRWALLRSLLGHPYLEQSADR